MTTQTILKKITNLETELQKLKLEAYLDLPTKQRIKPIYSEKAVLNAVRASRKRVWRKRYAKKV